MERCWKSYPLTEHCIRIGVCNFPSRQIDLERDHLWAEEDWAAMGLHFNELMDSVGDFGPWQWRVMIASYPAGILLLYHHLYLVFGGAIPDHWCSVPEFQGTNWTLDDVKRVSIPRETYGSGNKYSKCQVFVRNYSALASMDTEDVEDPGDVPIVNCHSWQYDKSVYGNTIVSEWDLVCDRLPLLSSVNMWYMIGVLFGSLIFGDLADRYGRRTACLVATVMTIVSCAASIFSVNLTMLNITRFFAGMGIHALATVVFLLLLEMISDRKRTMVTFIQDTSTAVGRGTLGLVAYMFPDWRHFLIAISIPVLYSITFYWIIPESPRWLLINGRHEEAQKLFEYAARVNKGKAPDPDQLVSFAKEAEEQQKSGKDLDEKKGGIFSAVTRQALLFVKTPEMRSRATKNFFLWFAIGIVTYGTIFAFNDLPMDPYMIHVLNGSIILVARICIIFWPLPDIIGRRMCFAACFLIGGIAELLMIAVPEDWPSLAVTLALACSIFVSMLFTLIYQYTSELFPTEARQTAVGLGSTVCRIGAILAPFVVHLLGGQSGDVPCAIFGSVAIAAGIVCLFLPETRNQSLPQTVRELEEARIKRNSKPV